MKRFRQEKIRELILAKDIWNQEELLRFLQKKGVRVTQATLSRDCGRWESEKGRREWKVLSIAWFQKKRQREVGLINIAETKTKEPREG